VKTARAVLVLLLTPALGAAQNLSEEQVADLKVVQATLRVVDRLEADGVLPADEAVRVRQDHLDLAARIAGQAVATPGDLDELVRQHDRSRFGGFFTFVNIVAVFAGILLAMAIGWLCWIYLAPLLAHLPPVGWEVLAYAGVTLGLLSGAIFPVLGIWFVVPAALLLIAALRFTRRLHFPPIRDGRPEPEEGVLPGEGWVRFSFSEFTALVCTVVWGIAAVYYRSYLLGFMSVLALEALLGFSVLVEPGMVGLGFRRGESVPRATVASFLILVTFVVLQIAGWFDPVRVEGRDVLPAAVYFRPGALFMGAFVYFLGLLILASTFYSGKRGNYLLMQGITIVSGVAAFYFGATFGIDTLLGIGGTFFVLYLLEKYTELPWKEIGWAWGLLGFAALLYATAYLAGQFPAYFLLGLK
jgi:hypothetical protein